MKKLFYSLLSVSILFPQLLLSYIEAIGATEDCYTRLLSGTPRTHFADSGRHYFVDSSLSSDLVGIVPVLERAFLALEELSKSTGCNERELGEKLSHHHESCHKFPGGQEVCVLERKIGQFIYAPDNVDGVNIIFNRWD